MVGGFIKLDLIFNKIFTYEKCEDLSLPQAQDKHSKTQCLSFSCSDILSEEPQKNSCSDGNMTSCSLGSVPTSYVKNIHGFCQEEILNILKSSLQTGVFLVSLWPL